MEAARLFVCLFAVWTVRATLAQVGTLCRSNERLLTCGGCQKTCVDPVPRCEGICRIGCYCEEGEVRNATGHCIKLADCPTIVYKTNPDGVECPLNEEYRLCESCNKTCDNPNPICPAQCSKGCFCKEGLVRDKDGKCVKYDQCSKFTQTESNNITVIDKRNCPPHQVFKLCENCEKTCSNPNPKCPAQCTKGCFCDDGFYKAPNGNCVKLQDCPKVTPTPLPYQLTCGPNQVFKICENCEKTCSNPNPICPAQCTKGCFCDDGFYKAPNGSCVKLENCPQGL